MSTLPKLLVLPLIASALVVPTAVHAGPPGEPQAPKVTHSAKAKKGKKAHRHRHARAPLACCRVVEVVPLVPVRRVCPPDFADQWYAQARLAWVGPTRCFPFQPNGFYPMPDFHSIVRPTQEQIDAEPEIVGDMGK